MSKSTLQDMMAKRTPLTQREAVRPADLYTTPQVGKSTSPQVEERTSPRVEKPVKPQMDKYTTHLRPETIKAIKLTALEQDKKDYEIVQQALDEFLMGGKGA